VSPWFLGFFSSFSGGLVWVFFLVSLLVAWGVFLGSGLSRVCVLLWVWLVGWDFWGFPGDLRVFGGFGVFWNGGVCVDFGGVGVWGSWVFFLGGLFVFFLLFWVVFFFFLGGWGVYFGGAFSYRVLGIQGGCVLRGLVWGGFFIGFWVGFFFFFLGGVVFFCGCSGGGGVGFSLVFCFWKFFFFFFFLCGFLFLGFSLGFFGFCAILYLDPFFVGFSGGVFSLFWFCFFFFFFFLLEKHMNIAPSSLLPSQF